MPKLPGICQRDTVRVFEKHGYRIARKNGCVVMTNGQKRVVMPQHHPINTMEMGSIAKDAGLAPNQFRALL